MCDNNIWIRSVSKYVERSNSSRTSLLPATFEVIHGSSKCGNNFMKGIQKIFHCHFYILLINLLVKIIWANLPVQSIGNCTFYDTFKLCPTVIFCSCSCIKNKYVSKTCMKENYISSAFSYGIFPISWDELANASTACSHSAICILNSLPVHLCMKTGQ